MIPPLHWKIHQVCWYPKFLTYHPNTFLHLHHPFFIPTSMETIFLFLLKPSILTLFPLLLRTMFNQSHIPPSSCIINFSVPSNFFCLAHKHAELSLILIEYALYLWSCISTSFLKRMPALTASTLSQLFTLVLSNLAFISTVEIPLKLFYRRWSISYLLLCRYSSWPVFYIWHCWPLFSWNFSVFI